MIVYRRRANRFALGALLGAVLLATMATADADAQHYKVVNQHSGMCLDVAHLSIANGAPVIQGDCWSPGANQQWRFVAAGGGWGQLRALGRATGVHVSTKPPDRWAGTRTGGFP